MQERRQDRGLVHLRLGKHLGNRQRMCNEGIAGLAPLALVVAVGELERGTYPLQINVGAVLRCGAQERLELSLDSGSYGS
jgi:hypothetical protein